MAFGPENKQWDAMPDVMTVDHVAYLLNLDPCTVYRKARTGEFPRMNMSAVRFDKSVLRERLSGSLKFKENENVRAIGSSRKKVKLCL